MPLAERVVVGDAYGSPYALDITDGTLLEKRQVVRGAVVALIPGRAQFAVFSSEGNISILSLRAAQN